MVQKLLLILLLVLPTSLLLHSSGLSGPIFAKAVEDGGDVVEGEEAHVEDDVAGDPGDGAVVGAGGGEDDDDEEAEVKLLKPSPDADTYFLFTKPSGMGLELPAGKDVHFLVGFKNKGTKDFNVETMDASFRYAMDFSFHLQNFTAIAYNRVVKPQQEATFAYSFFVSEAYSTRPYGFTVSLFYKDTDGNQYMNAVFNETVSIVELDEGLDGETFFLYIFLAACAVLLIVAGHQFLLTVKKKSFISSKPKIEMGTSNPNDVDYDWLPPETLNSFNKSPKAPKQSPRQRRVKRGTGSADD